MTAGILATDVLLNKPQIYETPQKKHVRISKKKSDIAKELGFNVAIFDIYVSSINSRTGYSFKLAA